MISLPPDLQEAVDRHVASGRFANTEDVLRAALDRLSEEHLETLRQSLKDEADGRMRPLSVIADEIRRKHGFADA